MTDVALRVKLAEGDQVFMVPEGSQVTVDLRPDPRGALVVISRFGIDHNHVWPEPPQQGPAPAPVVHHRGASWPAGGYAQPCDDEDCQLCD